MPSDSTDHTAVAGNANLRKLGYFSGPVDARAIYRNLKEGGHTSLFGTSYLLHLMRVCEDQGRDAVILTTHAGESYEEQLGAFTIINRPQPGGRGLRYHLDQLRWTRACLSELEKHGARTTVLTAAQHYWLVTPPFRKRGMRFVNSYHCAVRALGNRLFSPHELLIRLTSARHLSYGDPTMAVAPHILDQLRREPGARQRQTWRFIPDYAREMFESFRANPIVDGPVEIIFAGRVERNKGVFDMIEACEMLNDEPGPRYRFHFHGEGSALEELRVRASQSRHAAMLRIYGFTSGEALAEHYARSHIVVVPTRSDFDEGLAKSVIEGVLSLRPVVTSQVCPAIAVVGDACEEAEMDNPASYAAAFRRLAASPDHFDAKVAAAVRLREDYFEPESSYAATLTQALAAAESD